MYDPSPFIIDAALAYWTRLGGASENRSTEACWIWGRTAERLESNFFASSETTYIGTKPVLFSMSFHYGRVFMFASWDMDWEYI